MIGLVLTAGGARAAYQVGVLKKLGEHPRLKGKPSPFPIITGASAGAINGSCLAIGSDDFSAATMRMAELWSNLEIRNVFKTGLFALSAGSMTWLRDLSLGGIVGGGHAQSLLNFEPLRDYLTGHLEFDRINKQIQDKNLYALAISATSYYSGKSFTFIQGETGHPLWEKSRRVGLRTVLNVDHVWASCAIPIVFQPVKVKTRVGSFYFGDGGLRLTAPFSPAIRLGADRVFAVGVRSHKSAEARSQSEFLEPGEVFPKMKRPPLAQIFGIALNAMFLDHLDTDLDHLKRMNNLLEAFGGKEIKVSEMKEPMRKVTPIAINPSVDLANVAEQYYDRMPRFMSYMMEGLGSKRAESADLLSYLLFDSGYIKALIDIGYKDATEELPAIEEFLWG